MVKNSSENSLSKLSKGHKLPLLILMLTWGLFFLILFFNMVQIKSDGLYFGHVNLWGDWAIHLGFANVFAFKSPQYWFAYHPYFAEGHFTYPFVADMISGLLMRVGIDVKAAFVWPSVMAVWGFIVGFYYLVYLTIKSKLVAFVAVNFYIFSSGFGFTRFLADFATHPTISAILYPTQEYSRYMQYDWFTGNVAVGLLVPQRAFLLGATVAIWSLIGLLAVLQNKFKGKTKKILLASGVAAGLLPIIHPHSLIALVIITGFICLVNYKKWQIWLWYAVPAGVLSIILYLIFIAGKIPNQSFFSLLLGWTASGGIIGWAKMWLILWGVALPLALIGLVFVIKQKDKTITAFYLSFFAIFALANIFLFQPIRFDNTKLFWWAYVGFSALVAFVVVRVWRAKNYVYKSFAIILAILMCFTGGLEIIRLARTDKNSFKESSIQDVKLAKQIRQQTGQLDIFVTSPTQHNSPIFVWAARPILMGISGWVYSYGFNASQVEQDIQNIYTGTDTTPQLLKKHKVSYVVIGPSEINDMQANESYFANTYRLAFSNDDYRIYDVRSNGSY